jgi:hypothetical protein
MASEPFGGVRLRFHLTKSAISLLQYFRFRAMIFSGSNFKGATATRKGPDTAHQQANPGGGGADQ